MNLRGKLRIAVLAAGAAALAAWGLFSMAPFHASRPGKGEPAASFRNHLDARVPGLLARYGAPGVAIATIVNGKPADSFAYGLADVARRQPMTPDTVFEVASISKSLTAWGAMKLVEAGRFDLDAPIARYVAPWPLPPSSYPTGAVTARRLLNHTAGLNGGNMGVRDPDEPPLSTRQVIAGEGKNPMIHTSGPARQVGPAGEAFAYSNPGYMLVQLAIEQLAGQAFEEFMKREVLGPLGMASSSFDWDPALRPRTATPYLSDGSASPVTILQDAANGSLFTTAPDLARFVAAELRPAPDAGGLSATSLIQLFAPTAPLPFTQVQGMGSDSGGMGHYAERLADGRQAIMNGGFVPGWTSQFYLVPASGDGVVVLTNSDNGRAVIAEVVADWAAWRGLPPLKMTRTFWWVGTVGPAAVGVLAMIALALAFDIAADLVQGRRGWSGRKLPKIARAVGLLVAAGALAFLWFGVARMTLKFAFSWLDGPTTFAVGALAVTLIVEAALPRRAAA